MASIPSVSVPVVDKDGYILPGSGWHRFFVSLSQSPQAAQAPAVGVSPYSFAVPANGSFVVSGGTVSLIQLTRGRATVGLGVTSGIFPASTGDTFKITYTVAPTVTFLPG